MNLVLIILSKLKCLLCILFFLFQVCTAKMNLGDEVDLEDYVSRPDKISAAEVSFLSPSILIAAICQEAGMHAVRKNRYVILPKDFEKGYRSNVSDLKTSKSLFYFVAPSSASITLVSLADTAVLDTWRRIRWRMPFCSPKDLGFLHLSEAAVNF
ncbi:hypothetical protein BHE74_00014071 [Ensete ventricosum]|uniref:Uncharacterized protein n=1 Tax=Ensete ventricosum TaxID=4639 RepID=A0A445MBX8_ENSVE|nr:hypothetical protein BHE74_00014071 [Ensete ventricosum]RZR71761.1 hypothetical protein BHM03_00007138 [Ensete ventricosum]